MTSLGFGLNIPKKPIKKPTGPPTRNPLSGRKPPPGFGDDGDDDHANSSGDDSGGGVFASKGTKNSNGKDQSSKSNSRGVVNAQLATFNALSQKSSEAASANIEDASIYDYDLVYDSMKKAPRNSSSIAEAEESRKPKYMANLLAAAEIRKRDLLLAKERALQREREAEGDMYDDKEKFVTEAYRQQQEELRKAEEEEKRREERERAKSKGLTGFYRNLLDRTEREHDIAVKAAEVVAANPEMAKAVAREEEDRGEDDDKKAEKLAREINAKQAGAVEVNEEGQVVDKRQLLSAGLNVPTLPKKEGVSPTSTAAGQKAVDPRQLLGRKQQVTESRARQSRMLEQQLEIAQKRAAEEEDEMLRWETERQVKARKTEAEVGSARERYLARKKAAEEAKKGIEDKKGGV